MLETLTDRPRPAPPRQRRGDRLFSVAIVRGGDRLGAVGEDPSGRHPRSISAGIHPRQLHRDPLRRHPERRDLRAGHLSAGQHQAVLSGVRQQHDRRGLGDHSHPHLRLAVCLYRGASPVSLDPLVHAGQCDRPLRADHRAHDPALRDDALGRPAQLTRRRHSGPDRFLVTLCGPDPGALFRDHSDRVGGFRPGSTVAPGSPPSSASPCHCRPPGSPPAV